MKTLIVLVFASLAHAQTSDPVTPAPVDRSATGGAQTLADILARQKGEKIDDSFRSAPPVPGAPNDIDGALGTRGVASDPDLWRALRYNQADITTQSRSPAATVLVQDSGMAWLLFRDGPLRQYGAYLLGGTLLALALFLLIRGRIRIDGEKTGRRIERFKAVERFGHWMLAGSFIVLGLTGLVSLFGRAVLIPLFGHEAFSVVAIGSKWVHNNVAWAFILGLVMVFVMWVVHNLPDRTDIKWLLKGGGIFGGGHPPAKKFNAGQKIIFWSVIVLGSSIAVTGVSLLFPFELHLFAPTFAKLNAIGAPQWFGIAPLPEVLAPHQEMQLSQLWHAIVSFVLMAIVMAHIYIGSVGMEGAYDAMGSGMVEEQWAREHHSLWVQDVEAKKGAAPKGATPAE